MKHSLRILHLVGLTTLGLAAFVLAGWFGPRTTAQSPRYDLLIVNGRILDGSGGPWFQGSVAVKDGRIADVGRLPEATAREVIDAKGLVVAPGFIDLHTHSDYTLLVDCKGQSKIRQGVTTEIIGEDSSVAPVLGPAAAEFDKGLERYGLKRDCKKAAALEGGGGRGGRGGGGGGGGRGGVAAGPETLSSAGGSLTTLLRLLEGADAAPTTQLAVAVADRRAALAKLMGQWTALKGAELAALNARLKQANLPEVTL